MTVDVPVDLADLAFGIVNVFEWVLLILLPPMAIVTLRAWRLARKYWPRGYKLPTILALICTLAGAVATLFGIETVYRWRVGPIALWMLPLNAAAVVTLAAVVFLAAGYIIVLDQESEAPIQKRRATDAHGKE